jgi:hypothetical protein
VGQQQNRSIGAKPDGAVMVVWARGIDFTQVHWR